MAETEVLSDIVTDGMVEEELGKIALARASSEEVRRLGGHLVTVRAEVAREAVELAANRGIDIPQDLNEDYRAMLDRLSRLMPVDFDRQYVDAVLKEHERTVSQLMEDVGNISDPEVRSFAERAFEMVEDHFRLARLVAAKL
ncbi:MAG: DUF4142 domain-containing protein [Syntrophorhabdales bacterium]|jgi:putative membrane protein